MKIIKPLFLFALISFPVISSASVTNLGGLLDAIIDLAKLLIPIITALALLYFFWGVAEFVRSTGEEGKAEGKSRMFWGIIGLFVMISVWGIVGFLNVSIFGVSNTTSGGSAYSTGSGGYSNNSKNSTPPCYDSREKTPTVRDNPDGSRTVTFGNKELDPCKEDATDQILNIVFTGVEGVWDATKWSASKVKDAANTAIDWGVGVFSDKKPPADDATNIDSVPEIINQEPDPSDSDVPEEVDEDDIGVIEDWGDIDPYPEDIPDEDY